MQWIRMRRRGKVPSIQQIEIWSTKLCWKSMTTSFPEGHITWSTIAIAVTDLPAAQHSSQLVGHSANIYCTVCKCHQRSTLGRVNHYNWELWDDEKIYQHIEEWRDMVTLKDHIFIFNKHSNCYSELWQLPYWKPACQLVVNHMHWNYVMLIPVHSQLILLLTSADAAALIPPKPAFLHNFVTIDENEFASNDINKQKSSKSVLFIGYSQRY